MSIKKNYRGRRSAFLEFRALDVSKWTKFYYQLSPFTNIACVMFEHRGHKLKLLFNEAVVSKRNHRFVVAIEVCDRLLLGLCSFEMIPQLPYLPIDL